MPFSRFAPLLLAVLAAAALTVWLASKHGPLVIAVAMPVALIAALLVRRANRPGV